MLFETQCRMISVWLLCLCVDAGDLTMLSHDESECSTHYCHRCQRAHSYRALPQYTCEDARMKYIHPTYAWSTAPLPHDNLHWNSFSQSGMLEYKSLYYLSYRRIINWCPSLSNLYPVLTAGSVLFFSHFVFYITLEWCNPWPRCQSQ